MNSSFLVGLLCSLAISLAAIDYFSQPSRPASSIPTSHAQPLHP